MTAEQASKVQRFAAGDRVRVLRTMGAFGKGPQFGTVESFRVKMTGTVSYTINLDSGSACIVAASQVVSEDEGREMLEAQS